MVSSWHQIICSQRTVGPLLFHFDNNTRSVPHFNQSRARPSRRHHLFSFECGGGWIKTLAQWQNARLKYFNFPEDKLENCSRRRCCLCFLIILTLACSMWESVVNSSSWRERASEWASEWTSEQWRKQRVLYYISVLFYSLHRSSTAGDDDDDDDTEIAITEHMIAGREWEPRAALCNITFYITAQARPLYHCTCPDLRRAKFFVFRYRRYGRRRGEQRRGGETQPAESGA